MKLLVEIIFRKINPNKIILYLLIRVKNAIIWHILAKIRLILAKILTFRKDAKHLGNDLTKFGNDRHSLANS